MDALRKLKERDDRGALAALRRGLGRSPGEAAEMYPYVVPYLSAYGRDDWRFYLVASLFAAHQIDWPAEDMESWRRARECNLGASFAALRLARKGGEQGVERRFTALLSASQEDLPGHLRHVISLLKAEDVPVHFGQLLRDLRNWDAEDRGVQLRWARAFWASGSASTAESDAPEGSGTDTTELADDNNDDP